MKISPLLLQNSGKILLITCASLMMVGVSNFFATKIVERQVRANAESTLEAADRTINAEIQEFITLLFSAAVDIKHRLRKNASSQELQEFIKDFYDSFSRDKEVINPYSLYAYIDGKMISGTPWEFPPSFQAQQRPWFKTAHENPYKTNVSAPYVDSRTGKRVISLSRCLSEGVRTPGQHRQDVIGLDIDLDTLVNAIASFNIDENGYSLLLSQDLMFLSHFNKKRIGDYLWNLGPTQGSIAEALKKNSHLTTQSQTIFQFRTVDSADQAVFAFYKRLQNGWYVALTLPEEVYFHDIQNMTIIMSVIGILLIAFVSYCFIHMNIKILKAEERSTVKTNFLATMSHEIRTPLNAIIGMAYMLSRKLYGRENYHDLYSYVSIIHNSGMSLLSIINDTLDFSKIESGSMTLHEMRYSLISLLNDVINIVRVQIANHEAIDFIIHADANMPVDLFGDEIRVRQILMNLLSNAVKYTNYGFITLDIKQEHHEGNMLTLSMTVKDTGIGITKEDQGTLFTKFGRIEGRHSHAVEGTGLGLAIVQNLCRLMNGTVKLQSEYGAGSEFSVNLRQRVESQKQLAVVANPGSKSVLLFIHREMQQQSIVGTLQELGVTRLKTAETPEDFLAEFLRDTYDFALISSQYAQQFFQGNDLQALSTCLAQVEQTKLFVVSELHEILTIPGAQILTLPVYCVPLANMLNGIIPQWHTSSPLKKDFQQFIAPSANVLVVDDVATNLRVALEMLTCYNISVESCMNGAEALEKIKSKHYDLILMDHMMPKMNGLEAALRIRRMGDIEPYFRTVPIIAMTANAVAGQREIFLKHGFNDFLSKPLAPQALDVSLRKWIPLEKQQAISKIMAGIASTDSEGTLAASPGNEMLNVRQGMRNVGDNAAIYASILSICRRDCEFQMTQMEAALASDDLPAYAVAVHAIKGSLMTVGAEKFAGDASELETAAENLDTAFLQNATRPFMEDKLRPLLDSFSETIASLSIRDKPSEESLVPGLKRLADALRRMDIQQVNDFLAHCQTMPLTSEEQELTAKIDLLITTFEYEEAITVINNYAASNLEQKDGADTDHTH